MTRLVAAALASLLSFLSVDAEALDLQCRIGDRTAKLTHGQRYSDYPDIDKISYLAEETEYYFSIDIDGRKDNNHPQAEVEIKQTTITITDLSLTAWSRIGVNYNFTATIDRVSGRFEIIRLVRRTSDGWPFIYWTGECREGRPVTRF